MRKDRVQVSPWPWRGWMAAVVFAVVDVLGAFVFGLVAAFAQSERLADAAMVCGVSALVLAMGLTVMADGNVPQRGLPGRERRELERASARVRLAKEIARLEREVEL